MKGEAGKGAGLSQSLPGSQQDEEAQTQLSHEPGETAPVVWMFRLYVTGDAPQSQIARMNLAALCSQHLQGNCHVEIIDLLREPDRYIQDEILVTPTLVRYSPDPVCTLVGNLSNTGDVLLALGL